MIFYFSGPIWKVNVVHLYDFGYVSHNFDDSFELVSSDEVNDAFLEELSESSVNFSSELWIFVKELSHLGCQQTNYAVSSGVKGGDLQVSVSGFNNIDNVVNDDSVEIFGSQELVEGRFMLEFDSFGLQVVELGLEKTSEA